MESETTKEKRKFFEFTAFEYLLLIVGAVVIYLGYRLINNEYLADGRFSWGMITAIFVWMILILMFIILGIMLDSSRQQIKEIRLLSEMIQEQKTLIKEEDKLIKEEEEEVSLLKGGKKGARKSR